MILWYGSFFTTSPAINLQQSTRVERLFNLPAGYVMSLYNNMITLLENFNHMI